MISYFYCACDFFIFPSLYEGFGLPVLEAMKCGAPLLLSQTSSLPEVAGDCAHYFDPSATENLVEAFWDAYEDSQRVEIMRSRGLKRAKQFTWQNAARRILRLYSQYDFAGIIPYYSYSGISIYTDNNNEFPALEDMYVATLLVRPSSNERNVSH